MLESKIKRQCKKELEGWGWMVIHLIQTNQNGIPDTIILRSGRIAWLEFKQIGKQPEPLQAYRHKKLREQNFEVLVVSSLSDIGHLR